MKLAISIAVLMLLLLALYVAWPRPLGRIDTALVQRAAWPPALAPACYICGPTSFVEHATDLLIAHGRDRKKIKTERFGSTEGLK